MRRHHSSDKEKAARTRGTSNVGTGRQKRLPADASTLVPTCSRTVQSVVDSRMQPQDNSRT
jgi:hypothetical protein